MRAAFVILHYLAADVTERCIDTLLAHFPGDDVRIVVVDNSSPDGSGVVLADKYSENKDKVKFILLDRNVGFACGNNAGYRYAVENWNPDFVIALNNDVIIDNDAFLEVLSAEYEKDAFAVLGPDIFCPSTGLSQSPVRLEGMNLKDAEILRRLMLLKSILPFRLSRKSDRKTPEFRRHPQNNCVLHGACCVFSKDFTARRQYAFNPVTFLYAEEDILHLECVREGLAIRYLPSLRVLHFEDSSTKAAFGCAFHRRRMKYRRTAQSLKALVSLLNG